MSYNSNYSDEVICWDDLESNEVDIVGEVFWFASKINN